jgi:molybdopterin molybdotransferase
LPTARQLVAGFDWRKPGNRREFLRVRIGGDGRLERFPNQSSGVLTSCIWADGLADIPAGATVSPGDTVSYLAFGALP